MADVFLSYARADSEKALVTKDALEALGLSVFFDTVNLDAGDVFPQKLEDEIAAAGVVVSCWTTHALTRDWVLKECNLAREQGKLVPVEIGEIDEEVMTVAYSKIHRSDLTGFDGGADHPGWRELVRTLERRLGKRDLLKLAAKRAEAEKKAAAERERERKRLERLEARTKELEKSKGGLKRWQWALVSVITIAATAGTGWWALQQGTARGAQSAEASLRSSIITPEMAAAMDELNIENAPDARKALTALLANVSVPRLAEASAVGDARASLLAGWAYYFGQGDVPQNYSESVRLFRRACHQGSLRGCRALGVQYDNGEGVKEDDQAGNALYRQACDGGDMGGCTNLGYQYANGEGVEENDDAATALFRQACDGGDMTGCRALGVRYANGEGVEEDDQAANALFRQACDSGDMAGCNNLGVQYDTGEGVEEDDEAANALYRQACESGEMGGCRNLGIQYANGDGVEEDDQAANVLYRQACDGGDVGGCRNLGNQYNTGEGVEEDDQAANALYRQACDGGDMSGCYNLGVQYANGEGVSRDWAQALALFEQACDGGEELGCTNAEIARRNLPSTPPPPP